MASDQISAPEVICSVCGIVAGQEDCAGKGGFSCPLFEGYETDERRLTDDVLVGGDRLSLGAMAAQCIERMIVLPVFAVEEIPRARKQTKAEFRRAVKGGRK